jgi:gas vesicle protein
MDRNDSIGAGGFLVAFVAGAAVGAAVALLFAPASGDETRQYLGQRAREGRERAAEAARQGRERAAEATRQGREVLNRQREHVTTAFERARDQYTPKPPEGQDA